MSPLWSISRRKGEVDMDMSDLSGSDVERMEAEKDVEGLTEVMRHGGKHVRWAAAEALGKVGDARAVEPLIQAMQDEDDWLQEKAIEALGEIGDARAVNPLIQALKDERGLIQYVAGVALGKMGEPAVEPLLQALEDKDTWARDGAARALGEIGDAKAVEPLAGMLRQKDSRVRELAAEALGGIGEPALEHLIQALKDRAPAVRKAAAEALGGIGNARAVEPLIQTLTITPLIQDWDDYTNLQSFADGYKREVKPAVESALAKIGEPAVAPLIQALRDKDSWIRNGAARALAEIRDARAVEPLIRALEDEDDNVQTEAAYALGRIGDARAVAPLINVFRRHETVGLWRTPASAAAWALGDIGEAAIESLTRALTDEDHRVQRGAKEALEHFKAKQSQAKEDHH